MKTSISRYVDFFLSFVTKPSVNVTRIITYTSPSIDNRLNVERPKGVGILRLDYSGYI